MNLTHAFYQEQIQSGRRLSAVEQAALREHLAACPDCRAYAAFQARLSQELPGAYPARPQPEQEIREKARRVTAKLSQRRWPARLARHSLSLAGAGVVLGLLLVLFFSLPAMLPAQTGQAPAAALPTEERLAPALRPTQTARLSPTPAATEPALLADFPLYPGTTWVYSRTDYTQSTENPQKTLQATSQIEEKVLAVQSAPPYTIIQVQGKRQMLAMDPGWQASSAVNSSDYTFWYIREGSQVFISYTKPVPNQIQRDALRLVYQFPLQTGAEWCPAAMIKGTPVPDLSACFTKTIVTAQASYSSPLGEFMPCFEIHDTASSGDVIHQFCPGVGLVAEKYAHAGPRFGYAQELVQFVNGKDGSRLAAETPPSAPLTRPLSEKTKLAAPTTPATRALDDTLPSVAFLGQTAYLGAGSRLIAVNLQQPAAPQLAAESLELPAAVHKVMPLTDGPTPRVAAAAGRYLAVFDVSNPRDLSLITQSKLPGPIHALIVDLNSQRLFAAGALNGDSTKGFISVFDTTPADTLRLLGSLQLDAPVHSLALAPSAVREQAMLYAALEEPAALEAPAKRG